MDKLKIYVSTHKVFKPIYDNPIYEIVTQPQVDTEQLRKNTNLVIHQMTTEHPFYNMVRGFSDVSNIHWVWKHLPKTEYIGFAQFGAELQIDNPVSISWVEQILTNHSVICLEYKTGTTIRNQYGDCHYSEHFDELHESVVRLFPDEKKIFDEYCSSKILYYGDMFIMKYEDFDRLMIFLDAVMVDVIGKHTFKNDDDILDYVKTLRRSDHLYQSRMFGYMSERLISYFLYKMNNKYIVPFHDFETSF